MCSVANILRPLLPGNDQREACLMRDSRSLCQQRRANTIMMQLRVDEKPAVPEELFLGVVPPIHRNNPKRADDLIVDLGNQRDALIAHAQDLCHAIMRVDGYKQNWLRYQTKK